MRRRTLESKQGGVVVRSRFPEDGVSSNLGQERLSRRPPPAIESLSGNAWAPSYLRRKDWGAERITAPMLP